MMNVWRVGRHNMSSIIIAKSCGMSIQTAYGNVSKQPATFLTHHIQFPATGGIFQRVEILYCGYDGAEIRILRTV